MNPFDDTPHTGDFFVSTNPGFLDDHWLEINLLTQPWANTWTLDRLKNGLFNSVGFGLYLRLDSNPQEQVPVLPQMVGFARVITDGCTYSLLCDVVIDPAFRKRGLAKRLIAEVVKHGSVRGTVSLLRTSNAQKLYAQFGYEEVGGTMRLIPKS